jgi:hypothetical protein
VIIALASYSSVRLLRPSAGADLKSKVFVDAILFGGGFAAIIGVLGTLVGIVVTDQAIEAAGYISTTLVAAALRVALLTSAFGVLILAGSAVVWFALQLRWRLLEAADAPDELTA